MSDVLSIFSALVACLALLYAARAAKAAERSADAADKSVEVTRNAVDAARRSAEAAERANLLTREGIDRELTTSLVVQGWGTRRGGLWMTNPGPGNARDVLVVLAHPRRHARLAVFIANTEERLGFGNTNAWPDDFEAKELPELPTGVDAVYLRWTNEDGTIHEAGWLPVAKVPK